VAASPLRSASVGLLLVMSLAAVACSPFGVGAVNDGQVDASVDSGGVDGGALPIAFEQANGDQAQNATSATVDFFTPLKVHSAVIVALDYPSSDVDVTSVKDSLGQTYAIVIPPYDGGGWRHSIAVALDTKGGTDKVTVLLSAQVTFIQVYIHEYSGLALTDALDQTSAGRITSPSDAAARSGSVITTQDRELLFGFGAADKIEPGDGFARRTNLFGDVTEDRVVSTVGTYEATATAAGDWTMLMTTFKGRSSP
jgi:hypothetical protein